MHRNIKLLIAFSSLLMSMCTIYDQGGAVLAPNGLSCENRTDYVFFEAKSSATCYYRCPDGTARQWVIEERFTVSSSLYQASKEDVDNQYCQGSLQPPPTQTPTPAPPTPVPTRTERPTDTPTFSVPTIEIIVTQQPLLSGDVTMCNRGTRLINFRMIQAAPDLAIEGLEVEIGGQPSSCTVNPNNPSLLSCTLPSGITFPTQVLVRLQGSVVNDFTYDGVGCT
jgi:hypothetical protein